MNPNGSVLSASVLPAPVLPAPALPAHVLPDSALPAMTADPYYDEVPCGLMSTLPDGTVIRINSTFLAWSGLDRADVLGRRFVDLLTSGARIYYDTHYAPLLQLQGEVAEVALDLATRDGGRLPLLLNAQLRTDPDGAPLVVHISAFAASQRATYERELLRARRTAEESEARVRVLHRSIAELTEAADVSEVVQSLLRVVPPSVRASGMTVWLLDETTDVLVEVGRTGLPHAVAPDQIPVTAPLPAAAAYCCRQPIAVESPEAAGDDFPLLADALLAARVESVLAVPLESQGRLLGVYQLAWRRGRVISADELDLHATLGRQTGDALERARLRSELQHHALHDQLTGLANRTLLTDRLEQALARAERSGTPLTVMFCDLDGFKAVNDGLGHRAGDLLLIEVASRLRRAVRPADTVARLGGDEFAVLCEGADTPEAERIARAIAGSVRRPVEVEGDEASVSVSVGVVVHAGGEPTTAAAMLRDADTAMYEAKSAGKDRHTVYDAGLRAECAERARLEALLRDALDPNIDGTATVVVHYQPVVDLADGALRGMEALCRLDDGDTLVPPGEFIGVAEETGLIVALGQRVLEEACRQVTEWEAQGLTPVTVSVNVAAAQAARESFAGEVLATLARTGCPPERLVLELTESALLEATPATLTGLERLRGAGLGVSLDDFGTRYASLHYVQRLPLTGVKIDRSFVAGLPEARAERAIVRAVASLADDLGLSCTAEGIETREQLQFLSELGVLGQGYALARPMEPADCAELLRRGPHPLVVSLHAQRDLPASVSPAGS